MKDFSYISDIVKKSCSSVVSGCSLSRGTSRTSSTATVRRCLSDRRSQTNSHIYMLTGMLLDEMPDIYWDEKNILFVYQKGSFIGRRRAASTSRRICATQTPHSFMSAPASCHLSTGRRSITPSSSPRPARRPSRPNVSHTSSTRSTCCSHSPSTRSTTAPSRSTTSTLTIVRMLAHTMTSSGCTSIPSLKTVTPPFPSRARWTMTTSANRTTSTHSGCTPRSPCVLS